MLLERDFCYMRSRWSGSPLYYYMWWCLSCTGIPVYMIYLCYTINFIVHDLNTCRSILYMINKSRRPKHTFDNLYRVFYPNWSRHCSRTRLYIVLGRVLDDKEFMNVCAGTFIDPRNQFFACKTFFFPFWRQNLCSHCFFFSTNVHAQFPSA